MKNRHYIYFRRLPLLYARIPKVANSSVKYCMRSLLTHPAEEGVKTTADRFWQLCTHGETTMLPKADAARLRGKVFCFAFVRNPFDRLLSAYNNKILENPAPSAPMLRMGLYHGMPFSSFAELVIKTRDEDMDVHLLPQSTILHNKGRLVPTFIGRLESIQSDWSELRMQMKQRRLPDPGELPERNRRRHDRQDVGALLEPHSDLMTHLIRRYRADWHLFYSGIDPVAFLHGRDHAHNQPDLERVPIIA